MLEIQFGNNTTRPHLGLSSPVLNCLAGSSERGGAILQNFLTGWHNTMVLVGNSQELIQQLCANWQKQPLWADELQHGAPIKATNLNKNLSRDSPNKSASSNGAQADLSSTPCSAPPPTRSMTVRGTDTCV